GERPGDCRRAHRPLHDARRQVARADLACVHVETLQLVLRQPDTNVAVEDADRRRYRTRGADPRLRLEADRNAFAAGEAGCDQRRPERDDGAGLPDFVGDDDHGIAPSCPTQRAAASTASCGPPTRKPAASASPAPVASTTSPGGGGSSTRSSPRMRIPREPRLTTAVGAREYAPPRISHSASFAKTTSGSSDSTRSRNRAGPYSRI